MKNILILSITLLISSNSFAQDIKDWRASLGVGIAVKKNLRVDNRYEHLDKKIIVRPIPFIQGSIGRFSLGPQGISVRAVGNHLTHVSFFIKRDGDRYQGYGMIPRKDSAFVGVTAKFFKYGLNVSKDINGRSKGMVTQFNYGELFPLSESVVLRAGLSLEWFDDKYAEYYYGVRPFESTPTRREYHLNNYVQPGVNVMPIYKISEKVTFTGIGGIKFVPKTVRNSPTMNGDKFELGLLAGISYNF
jgi:outer membrane scaffolding protein for murein synthesis (MipA/OmpV family)